MNYIIDNEYKGGDFIGKNYDNKLLVNSKFL